MCAPTEANARARGRANDPIIFYASARPLSEGENECISNTKSLAIRYQ